MLAAAFALSTGCAARAQPYRFASPLLGSADVPAQTLPGAKPASKAAKAASKRRASPVRVAGGWQADAQHGSVRTVSARGIDAKMPTASAQAASQVTSEGNAREVVWSRLPAPHRGVLAPSSASMSILPRPAAPTS
jgi:hypothetical protein